MAGIHADMGDTSHRIVTGEMPVVGLRVITNDLKRGTIVALPSYGLDKECGYYCPAWFTVLQDDGVTISMNCDRLATRSPLMR